MQIVIPDNTPPMYTADHPALDELRELGDVRLIGDPGADDPEELALRLRGAVVAVNVRAYATFSAAVLRALPQLRHLAIAGTGTDNVDLDAASKAGVVVTNTPGVTRRSVAEHTLALLFACARSIPWLDRTVRSSEWLHRPAFDLDGKTLGVIGLGAIGQEVARLAAALGMRVLAWSPSFDPQRAAGCGAALRSLDDLYAESDLISLHLRNTPKVRHFWNTEAFAKMKDGVVLINTARGALVDDDALVAALQSGKVSAAGLDVFDPEPLRPDHPFRDLPNLVLTPHAAVATPEANNALLHGVSANIRAWVSGAPTNVVKPTVGG